MAEIISLRLARKTRQREDKAAAAAEMRAKFGRSKDQRLREAITRVEAERRHGGHKLDEEPEE